MFLVASAKGDNLQCWYISCHIHRSSIFLLFPLRSRPINYVDFFLLSLLCVIVWLFSSKTLVMNLQGKDSCPKGHVEYGYIWWIFSSFFLVRKFYLGLVNWGVLMQILCCSPTSLISYHLIIRNGMSGNPALIKVFWHFKSKNYLITEKEMSEYEFPVLMKTTWNCLQTFRKTSPLLENLSSAFLISVWLIKA